MVKNPPSSAGDIRDAGSVTGSGRSPGGGNGNPFHYSCLENPMDRGGWRAAICGVAESDMTERLSMCADSTLQPLRLMFWNFPEGSVVKASLSNAEAMGFIPGQGTKILCALQAKIQNIEQKQYCNKLNKDFKNGPHQKILKKKSVSCSVPLFFFFFFLFFSHSLWLAGS